MCARRQPRNCTTVLVSRPLATHALNEGEWLCLGGAQCLAKLMSFTVLHKSDFKTDSKTLTRLPANPTLRAARLRRQ